jgi:hypothetical protein
MVQKIIDIVGRHLESDATKASVSEFVRLLQIEKELADQDASTGPREVRITWLQPKDEEPIPAA